MAHKCSLIVSAVTLRCQTVLHGYAPEKVDMSGLGPGTDRFALASLALLWICGFMD